MSTNSNWGKQSPSVEAANPDALPESPSRSNSVEFQHPEPPEPDKPEPHQLLRIYSHSSLFFWWPVWVVGYLMAFLTYWHGRPDEAIGQEWFHPSNNLGVIFFLVLFLVILITNFSVRGLASGIVIMGALLLTIVLAFIGWWDEVFSWFGHLKIHLTLGAYFWFSTLMCLAWTLTVFGLDRMSYWEFSPGQLTHKSLLGAGSQSYNAQGMGLEKHRDDLFRHWLLGLGSGDLVIRTSGASRKEIDLLNVLFIGSKVEMVQRLIAEVPEEAETS